MKQQIQKAQLEDVFYRFERDIYNKLNCHRVGIIQSFDSTNMTASVKIVDKPIKETNQGVFGYNFPLLIDCPVFMPISNKNKGLTYPINVGDECLVIFNDRDIDNWFEAGIVSTPKTGRTHHLSDAIVIVGLHSKINQVENFNNQATILKYEESQIALDDKINIQNQTKNLIDILDNLITTLKNLTVDDAGVPLPTTNATKTALDAINAEFKQLFK